MIYERLVWEGMSFAAQLTNSKNADKTNLRAKDAKARFGGVSRRTLTALPDEQPNRPGQSSDFLFSIVIVWCRAQKNRKITSLGVQASA